MGETRRERALRVKISWLLHQLPFTYTERSLNNTRSNVARHCNGVAAHPGAERAGCFGEDSHGGVSNPRLHIAFQVTHVVGDYSRHLAVRRTTTLLPRPLQFACWSEAYLYGGSLE